MEEVYVAADNIITSLGFTTDENISKIKKNITGIKFVDDQKLFPEPFYASLVDSQKLISDFSKIDDPVKFTRFEQMALLSIKDALSKTDIDIKSKKTLFILSTTKGNIDLLENNKKNKFDRKRLYLWETASVLQKYFGNPNTPLVVSNACISGIMAILIGTRLLRSSHYENVVITGADIVSEFVVSGFLSFKSLSNGPCRPFDITRDGLSLGEGCGTIILTSNSSVIKDKQKIILSGGSSSNDANHISGPSRTGEGLFLVIQNTLKEVSVKQIDFISAHGTATPYNDEMEAIAISRAGLEDVPVNSLKGFWGHTLGAAGVIESIASIYSMKNNILFNTIGFNESGVSKNINVIHQTEEKEINNCLKLASGFGGCNAGVLFLKK